MDIFIHRARNNFPAMRITTKHNPIESATRITTICAQDDNAIAYIPRMMAQLSLPARNLGTNEYTRVNGRYKLTMVSPSEIGLPYGMAARSLLCFIATQSKKMKTNEIYIGNSISALVKQMGKISSGGKNGSITGLREQCKRLFSTTIHCIEEEAGYRSIETLHVTSGASLLWEPKQTDKWESYLFLDEKFFNDIQSNAVPIDRRVKDHFYRFPLAFDIYCWLTYRFFFMAKPSMVTWEQLKNQFGNIYARHGHFKYRFSYAISKVSQIYTSARFSIDEGGILLRPSLPHIKPEQIR